MVQGERSSERQFGHHGGQFELREVEDCSYIGEETTERGLLAHVEEVTSSHQTEHMILHTKLLILLFVGGKINDFCFECCRVKMGLLSF